jgi:hypothetical protein
MYDHIVISLILVVDSALLYLAWLDRRKKERVRNSRKFNRILKSVGLR